MSSKKGTGSGSRPKGSLKISPNKPTGPSPRKPRKGTTGIISKTITRQTPRKGKCRKTNATPLRANKKRKTKTSNALPAVKEDDKSSEDKVEDVIKKRPSPKATPITIFNPAAKAEGDVGLFGQVLEPQKFKLGHIISIALREEVYQDAKNRIKLGATREQTLTPLGWVYSKNRKMVVISRFSQYLVGLPIFSHGGKGLENKEKSEFVGIRNAQYFRGTPTDSKQPNLTSHWIAPFIPANEKTLGGHQWGLLYKVYPSPVFCIQYSLYDRGTLAR
ncbi:hypothetical protein BKA61DRAFT_580331 [Leptodontidium sp. MPI-SDFR-AT-0119]|nr:hypothetical protein BKA61DRAFT_580331 [Leptodontidium sp. MPI-SDFR-AT-0119]